jgi:hypothetical protein
MHVLDVSRGWLINCDIISSAIVAVHQIWDASKLLLDMVLYHSQTLYFILCATKLQYPQCLSSSLYLPQHTPIICSVALYALKLLATTFAVVTALVCTTDTRTHIRLTPNEVERAVEK